MNTAYRIACLLIASAALTACSSLGVSPWEKGILAKEEMLPVDDPLRATYEDHIYFSKEATSGGRGFGGGGCGCN